MRFRRFVLVFCAASLLASDGTAQPGQFDLFATSGGSVLRIDANGNATPFVTTALPGEPGGPLAIAFDRDGNLFLSQGFTGQVQSILKFSPEGVPLGVFASIGTIDPFEDLIFDRAGNLYASDFSVNQLWRFSPLGVADLVATTGDGPAGLAFDDAGNLFVALVNSGGGMIAKFSPDGALLKSFGIELLTFPVGLAVDKSGLLYVSSLGTNDIRRFTQDGVFVDVFASTGLSDPHMMDFDAVGDLYVANNRSGTIRRFSATGVDLGDFVQNLDHPGGLKF